MLKEKQNTAIKESYAALPACLPVVGQWPALDLKNSEEKQSSSEVSSAQQQTHFKANIESDDNGLPTTTLFLLPGFMWTFQLKQWLFRSGSFPAPSFGVRGSLFGHSHEDSRLLRGRGIGNPRSSVGRHLSQHIFSVKKRKETRIPTKGYN